MTRNNRLTVEELVVDCLDVREIHRAGFLNRRCVPRWPEIRWPGIERICFGRGLIHIEFVNRWRRGLVTVSEFPAMLCLCMPLLVGETAKRS